MSKAIVVVGAGVIGLTTSIRILQSSDRKVIILAKDLPGDALVPTYASPCAGAHHLSFAANDDVLQRKVDKRTFDVMWEQIHATDDEWGKRYGAHLLKLTQTEFYCQPGEKHVSLFEDLPDFKVLKPPKGRTPEILHSVSFTSMTMDTGPYLEILVAHFKALGGVLERADLGSLGESLKHPSVPSPVEAIINCTGLGSITLSDVSDTSMYPVRGHVLVLDAPWIKEGRTRQVGSLSAFETIDSAGGEELGVGEGGERTYIIPRRSGQVVIGGTREVGEWSAVPVPETTLSIKRRALEIFPELSPVYHKALMTNGPAAYIPAPVAADLDGLLLTEVVGFRPARRDGLRLEKGDPVDDVQILHNYGHSGAGWQACWGCAEAIVALL